MVVDWDDDGDKLVSKEEFVNDLTKEARAYAIYIGSQKTHARIHARTQRHTHMYARMHTNMHAHIHPNTRTCAEKARVTGQSNRTERGKRERERVRDRQRETETERDTERERERERE